MYCKYFFQSVVCFSLSKWCPLMYGNLILTKSNLGFPGGLEVKASASNVGDPGLIPGSGRSPGEGNGNPLQYSCLENPMDGEAWLVVYSSQGRKESDMTERLHSLHLIWSIFFPSFKNCDKAHIPENLPSQPF